MRTARPILPAAADARAGGYLTFYLGTEEYGLPLLTVREIIGMPPVTRVPCVPEYVRGVINLRGQVVPITDLRLKFAVRDVERRGEVIIVVQVAGVHAGLVVDRVSEVVTMAPEALEDAPVFGAVIRHEFLLGVDTTGGRTTLLLDIDRVLASSGLTAVEHAASAA